MKYIDLFAGVGGFHYGISKISILDGESQTTESTTPEPSMESKGQSLQPHRNSPHHNESGVSGEIPYSCVYSNEWDKYANSVYKKHFGECDDRDITTVPASEIPDFDLLCGGFPCQAFSVAGKRGGFDDTRGTLFFEIARIAHEKQPRLLFLENVKGLLNHDKGRTFRTILATLDELGYDVQWQVLNSKNFNVPQNRERVFIIGHLRGTTRPEVFPLRHSTKTTTKRHDKKNTPLETAQTLRSRYGNGSGSHIAVPVSTPNRLKKSQNGRRFKEDGEPIFTLTQQDIHGVYTELGIRRLTPLECERLQGFPDNWTQFGDAGQLMSDTQRYKMMGNAVTTTVVTAIAQRIYEGTRQTKGVST